MDNRISSLGQGPGLAWKRSTSSFPPGSLAELQEWTGGKTEPPWHGEVEFQQWNTVGWAITYGGSLCIKPWEGNRGTTGASSSSGDVPWYNQRSNIKKVESIGSIVLNANSTRLFSGCSKLTDLTGLADWNTSNVTNMNQMFYGCSSLTDLSPLAKWNVSNVTNMSYMFMKCPIADITSIKGWNVSNVTDISAMFYDCPSLTDLTGLAYWNVSKVTKMSSTFYGCSKLQKIGIPSIANGCQKLVNLSGNSFLITVLPRIISEDGAMGPFTWPELSTEMTTNPAAFQDGTVWVRA